MRASRQHFFSLLCVLVMVTMGSAQDVRVRRVTDHVTVFSMANLGMHTNVTVIQSEKGLVVIETEITPYIMGKIKEAAERALGRDDWAYVINTHNHLHHAGGNVQFKGAQFISHATMRMDWLENLLSTHEGRERYCDMVGVRQGLSQLRGLLAQGRATPRQRQEMDRRIRFMEDVEREIMAGFEVVNPTIAFEGRYTLDLGDVHLRLIYWGDAINHSSVFIHVVEDNMLVGMGMGKTWLTDFYGKVSLDSIRRAIKLLEEFGDDDLQIDLMIGVHTADFITTRQHFRQRRGYLDDLLKGLTLAKQQGLSLRQVKEEFSLARRYAHLPGDFRSPQERRKTHQSNIDKIWKLLEKESSPSP
jgi:glyoxylase-like metal-dependent hydrolase (beta-lactamase superfamily II)